MQQFWGGQRSEGGRGWAGGGCEPGRSDTVHLHHELGLDAAAGLVLALGARACDGVDLVDEDSGRRVVPAKQGQISARQCQAVQCQAVSSSAVPGIGRRHGGVEESRAALAVFCMVAEEHVQHLALSHGRAGTHTRAGRCAGVLPRPRQQSRGRERLRTTGGFSDAACCALMVTAFLELYLNVCAISHWCDLNNHVALSMVRAQHLHTRIGMCVPSSAPALASSLANPSAPVA